MKLDGDVNNMLNQLSAAEKELEKKKAEANQDMMMASMVCEAFPVRLQKRAVTTVIQANSLDQLH